MHSLGFHLVGLDYHKDIDWRGLGDPKNSKNSENPENLFDVHLLIWHWQSAASSNIISSSFNFIFNMPVSELILNWHGLCLCSRRIPLRMVTIVNCSLTPAILCSLVFDVFMLVIALPLYLLMLHRRNSIWKSRLRWKMLENSLLLQVRTSNGE